MKIQDIRVEHLGKKISVNGIITKISNIMLWTNSIVFACIRCGTRIRVEQLKTKVAYPKKCVCRGKEFRKIEEELQDFVEMTLQEDKNKIRIKLLDELVSPENMSKLKKGNRITVIGIVERFKNGYSIKATDFSLEEEK